MNVIISNEFQNELSLMDIDVIKSINGVYSAGELVEMFGTFFYDRMILDVTALKDYNNINSYKTLVDGLSQEKLILLLPAGSDLCTPNFLAKLISFGIYNFTTNPDGVSYLLKKPNTHDDVADIEKMATGDPKGMSSNASNNNSSGNVQKPKTASKQVRVVGFHNVTASSGATSLIYMLKKELCSAFGTDNVIAIEVNKNDFSFLYDGKMISVNSSEFEGTLAKFSKMRAILVDLNGSGLDNLCDDVIYLIEPSTIKLNTLMRKNRNAFAEIAGKKIVLNQCLLLENDVADFESESGLKVSYCLPPLDDRKRNDILHDFAIRMGMIPSDGSTDGGNKIFGLFRK